MFTRSSSVEPQPLRAAGPDGNVARNAPQQQVRPRPTEAGPKSVIGNDLKIIGQGLKIISQGTLQVDGDVEGDGWHVRKSSVSWMQMHRSIRKTSKWSPRLSSTGTPI